jgi:hypothetical protein
LAEIKKRSVKTPQRGNFGAKFPIKYFSLPEKRRFSLRKRGEEDMKFFFIGIEISNGNAI